MGNREWRIQGKNIPPSYLPAKNFSKSWFSIEAPGDIMCAEGSSVLFFCSCNFLCLVTRRRKSSALHGLFLPLITLSPHSHYPVLYFHLPIHFFSLTPKIYPKSSKQDKHYGSSLRYLLRSFHAVHVGILGLIHFHVIPKYC